MKTSILITALMIAFASPQAIAQVEITPDDIPSEPGTESMFYAVASQDGIEVDPGEAGEDREWDFTEFIFGNVQVDESIDPDDAPHIDAFEDANMVVSSRNGGFGFGDGLVHMYESLTDESWDLLGFSPPEENELGVDIGLVVFPEPLTLLPMPAEFGDDWEFRMDFTVTVPAPDTLEAFDSLDVTIAFEGNSEIDAWGSVSYPCGEVEALRQYAYSEGNVTTAGVRWLWGRRIVIDLPFEYVIEGVHTYRWFSPELGELASISSRQGEEDQDFNLASQIRMRFLDDAEHFDDLNRTVIIHRIYVEEAEIDDEAAAAGVEFGVFTPEGVLAGAGVWRGGAAIGFPAYRDDPGTDDVEGFVDGEAIGFRAWDPDAEEELDLNAQFVDGPEEWEENASTTVALTTGGGGGNERELTIPLVEGWNLISLNVSPGEDFYAEGEDRGPDIVLMTEQLRIDEDDHFVEILKDENGRFYLPSFGFNNIPYWDLTQAYAVKSADEVEATWNGEPIPFDAEIPLEEGWNFAAYYPTYELSSDNPRFYVVTSIIDHLIIAKDVNGRFLVPDFNFSSMGNWRETQGYQIKVDEDVVLVYPPEEDERANRSFDTSVRVRSTDRNMSLLLTNVMNAQPGRIILAEALNGRIVGEGVIDESGRCGLAIWGDDPTTVVKDGLAAGEAFSLRESSSGEAVSVQWLDGEPVYTTDALAIGRASLILHPSSFALSEPYPNPFNAHAILNYNLVESGYVRAALYDVSGKQVELLVNSVQTAGRKTLTVNGVALSSGIYVLKLAVDDGIAVKKLVLLR